MAITPIPSRDIERMSTIPSKVRVWRIGNEDDVRVIDASEFKRGYKIDWDEERRAAHKKRKRATRKNQSTAR